MAELIAGGAYGGAGQADQFGQGEDVDGDQGEEEEEVDVHDQETGEINKKAGLKGRTWSKKEDVLLCEAWMAVSLNGTIRTNQTKASYWRRIHKDYTERRSYPRYNVFPDRNAKSVESRWGVIHMLTNKFHGCHEQIRLRDESGKNDVDKLNDALHMYVDLEMDNKKPYKLMHCWESVRDSPKWKKHRLSVSGKEGDERKLPASSAERPDGVKACKEAKKTASSGTIQESVGLYVKDVSAATTRKLKIHADNEEKWRIFIEMQKTKLKASERSEERLLMATNTNDMSPNQKAYFVDEWRRIQAERAARVPAAEAAAAV